MNKSDKKHLEGILGIFNLYRIPIPKDSSEVLEYSGKYLAIDFKSRKILAYDSVSGRALEKALLKSSSEPMMVPIAGKNDVKIYSAVA